MHSMIEDIWWYATAAGLVLWLFVAAWSKRRRGLRELRDVSDSEFLAWFEGVEDEESVLRERKWIAKTLGLPERKLAPDNTLGHLRDLFNVVATFDLRTSNLEDDLLLRLKTRRGLFHEDRIGEVVRRLLEEHPSVADE